jgi:hypothetical protein
MAVNPSKEVKVSIRILIAGWTAATLGVGVIQAQQQPQPSAQSQPSSNAAPVTFNGCVYRVADQPTMFALERTADADTTGTQTSGATRQPGAPAAGGAVGTSGTLPADARSDVAAGTWYRLSSTASDNLADHVGPVRITGTVAPGRDEKGADVVVHRIDGNKVTVTAVDLKPAPQLTIQSITHVEGQCRQAK